MLKAGVMEGRLFQHTPEGIPPRKSVQRLHDTIKGVTKRPTFYQTPLEKLRSINRVLRGWNQYYKYANTTASKLTYWANDQVFRETA